MKNIDFKVNLPSFKDTAYNIINYGANGNGKFNNQTAINNAIKECSKEGGGKVIIPRGIWFTGPIELESNVNLHLESGAVIYFSKNFDDYPLIYTSWEGFFTYRCMPQIYGKDLNNIAITGEGVIDGNGSVWRPVKRFKMTDIMWNKIISKGGVIDNRKEEIWWPSASALEGNKEIIPNPSILKDKELCQKYRDYLRPVLLNLTNCKNILIEGVTFQNSPAWCLHPWLCEHLTVNKVSVRNPWFSQNGDGIDVDSCKYVEVKNSTFDVGDDAMCVKSGKNEDGRDLGKPCEYVIFKNCTVYHGHGGFTIGSEMSGGVKNIKVENCTFISTDTGLRFKSCLGRGGIVENVYIDNINMTDIPKEAIIFTMGYDMDTKAGKEVSPEEVPEFKNIYIDKINCTNAQTGLYISGLSQKPVHDIYLTDINISAENPTYINMAENIKQKNVNIIIK